MSMIYDEDEFGLKENVEYTGHIYTDYIKMRPEKPGVWIQNKEK